MPRVKVIEGRSDGKRQAKRGEKRRKQAAITLKLLQGDARLGTYRVDNVAESLLSWGTSENVRNVTEIAIMVRRYVNVAAEAALLAADNQFEGAPRRRRMTKRFFEDVRSIQSRINRNKDLRQIDLILSIDTLRPRSPAAQHDKIRNLLLSLEGANKAVEEFLELYRPMVAIGGNRDDFTRTFIDKIFNLLWCGLYAGKACDEEFQRFLILLIAAWQDVGFPENEEEGRLLEDWLADRVRKQFRAGIPSARAELQEELSTNH